MWWESSWRLRNFYRMCQTYVLATFFLAPQEDPHAADFVGRFLPPQEEPHVGESEVEFKEPLDPQALPQDAVELDPREPQLPHAAASSASNRPRHTPAVI